MCSSKFSQLFDVVANRSISPWGGGGGGGYIYERNSNNTIIVSSDKDFVDCISLAGRSA